MAAAAPVACGAAAAAAGPRPGPTAGAWPPGWPGAVGAAAPAKRQRGCSGAERWQHGVSLSDHGEKATWSGYWEERERRLQAQAPDASLYSALASRLSGQAAPRAELPASGIFQSCRIYFNGRVDVCGGLSAFALGKLARLHGAEVVSRLTMGRTTHVVCTQLSGAKERKALSRAASRASKGQYYVVPEWIAQSVAAGRRLSERRFSVLARVARDAGVARPEVIPAAARQAAATGVTIEEPLAAVPAAVAVEDSPVALDSGSETAADSPACSGSEGAPPTELDSSDDE